MYVYIYQYRQVGWGKNKAKAETLQFLKLPEDDNPSKLTCWWLEVVAL